ncbi:MULTISPECIES: hypothetical protein [unclassified Thioalkalivibrio]|uniref:hypothetical protein n=1 Tax=unclassified Thioalkalivibrio TaxID=2621013 RepID=UPI00037D1802|nr:MULTISPECIES: hypothetical protein [unclassified Thioalkalivibrio]
MAITILMVTLAIVVAIVLLDWARNPVRTVLLAITGGLVHLVCALRRHLVHVRDAVTGWHRRYLARLEADRIHGAVEALERRYAHLVGHDLAQMPQLRQESTETLRALREAYERDETRLLEEPAWVSRLEALASTPVSDTPQSQRLAQDLQETILRIARLGMEEHRQLAQGMLAARRRLESPVDQLVGRLEGLQRRLGDLQRQGGRLDHALTRCEQTEPSIRHQMPSYIQAVSQGLLGLLGLALTVLAVTVYHQLFGPPFDGQFPGAEDAGPGTLSDRIIALLLGIALVSGWLLAESRGAVRLLPQAVMERDNWARMGLVVTALLVLAAVVVLSGLAGYHLEWVRYRNDLLETLMAGEVAPPPTLYWTEQMVGAAVGLVVPLVVALAPLWLVSLLQAIRVLVGGLLGILLALLTGVLHLLAVIALQLRRLLPALFELVTFPARAVRERLADRSTSARDADAGM